MCEGSRGGINLHLLSSFRSVCDKNKTWVEIDYIKDKLTGMLPQNANFDQFFKA